MGQSRVGGRIGGQIGGASIQGRGVTGPRIDSDVQQGQIGS